MQLQRGARPHVAIALAVAALLVGAGCDPPPVGPSPVPGATPVRGTERLAWTQAGDVASLRFRAYVDDRPLALDAAACDRSAPEAACTSPLPPLTDGVHTIALAALSRASGLESAPTAPITVQKISPGATTSAASFPDAMARPGSVQLETVVTTANGLAFAVDIVARGVQAPAQLAWLPDGRLLVAEADGRVRVVRPGEPERGILALDTHDARALLAPAPTGPLGLASHPHFLENGFVYVAFLAWDRPDRTLLRIVRLREAGDTLGEPASLFEAPVTASAPDGPPDNGVRREGAPLVAFGPDGLLYVALPLGVEFDHEPAASSPLASMLRLSDDGRVPDVGPLSGVGAHPLGFTWHPSTGALLVAFPAENGEAELRPITAGRPSGVVGVGADRVRLRMTERAGRSSGALTLQRAETAALDELARAFVAAPENQSPGMVRLTLPILSGSLLGGVPDRIGDIVAGSGGTLFLATNNAGQAGGVGVDGEDVIVRLTPRAR